MAKTVLLIDSATKLIVAETNPPGDLTTIEEMQGQGFTSHSADHQWVCRTLVAPASGMTITNSDGVAGDPTFAFTGDFAGLLGLTGTGFAVRETTGGTWVTRSLTGTANQISISDPDGLTGNPTFSLPQDIGTGSTMTLQGLNVTTLHVTGATGLQKAVGGTLTDAISGTDFAPATFTGATGSILKNDLSGGFTAAVARTDYLPATTGAAMQKADGAGGLTGATPNTDFLPATTGSAIQKAVSGGLTGAVSGVDYAPATFTGATGSVLKNDLSGGFTAATMNLDYLPGTTGNSIQKAAAGGLTAATANTDFLPATSPVVTDSLSTPALVATNTVGSENVAALVDYDFSGTPNWTGTNWVRPVTGTLTTVAVDSGAKTFTRTGGDFTADGFQVGMTVTWTGFTNGGNNGSFIVTTLTNTVMTCSGAAGLVTEGAGASVSASSNVWSHLVGANATTLANVNLDLGTPVTGQVFQLVYTVVTNTTGALTPSFGGSDGRTVGSVGGTIIGSTETITVSGSGPLTFTPDGSWVGWIDTVSLKPITPATVVIGSQSLGAQTLSAVKTGLAGSSVSKYQWSNAMVAGLGASLTGDLKVCTLPARTIVKNAYIVIDSAAGGVTTLTVALGRTGASYIDYIVASDAKAAANTVYGDGSAERGTNLTGYDMGSLQTFTDIYLHFVSTGTNLSTVTTSTGTVYLETVVLP